MEMLNKICSWTGSETGTMVVGASVLVLGLSHFGWASNMMSMGVAGVTIGTVAGVVGVTVGACTLLNAVM